MERLSDRAIEIIDELHRERLDYNSEYTILIDAANKLSSYEETGLDPEEVVKMGMMFEDSKRYSGRLELKLNGYQRLGTVSHLRKLTQSSAWVSVAEGLPCLRENVLVCAYWHEHWGVYMGWNSGHGWNVSCGIGQRNDVLVSHWMPLPAPPDCRPPEGDANGE